MSSVPFPADHEKKWGAAASAISPPPVLGAVARRAAGTRDSEEGRQHALVQRRGEGPLGVSSWAAEEREQPGSKWGDALIGAE